MDSCCCCAEDETDTASLSDGATNLSVRTELGEVALENQDGVRLTFAEAFAGRPSALAFFYTRRMNPEKCSLTLTRLGRLARLVAESGLGANVAGMS